MVREGAIDALHAMPFDDPPTVAVDAFDRPPPINGAALIAALRRNALLIGATLGIALLLALVVTLFQTPRYTADASIQIDQDADEVLPTAPSALTASRDLDADRILTTEVDVLGSRRMAEQVADSPAVPGAAAFLTAMQVRAPADPSPAALREAELKALRDNLVITLPPDSRLVTIAFRSPSPTLSAAIANGYATGFIAYTLGRKFDSSAYARSYLAQQLEQARGRVEASERALNGYARAIGYVRTEEVTAEGQKVPGQSITVSSLNLLNTALAGARARRIAAEQKWRAVANSAPGDIADVLDNRAYQAVVQNLAVKRAQLAQELAIHQAAFPTVAPLRDQIATLQGQADQIAGGIKQSIRIAYTGAAREEGQLAAQVAALKGRTLDEQGRAVRYALLARDAETDKALYDALLNRYRALSAEAGITLNNISIVDHAQPPTRPSSPRLGLNLAVAAIAGLALAALMAFLREYGDDRIRAPDDVERKLGLPLMGTIPEGGAGEDLLATLANPRSRLGEAAAALRTGIAFSTPDGAPSALFITSSMPGEGKSTVALALATAFARLDRRVLLIELDLRRPSLQHVLDLAPDGPGASNILTGQGTLAALVQDSPRLPGVRLLAAGPLPPSPTELFASDRLLQLLDAAAAQFDMAIIDGPPVLGLADAPIVAAHVATLFVIESGRAHRGAAKAALRRLRGTRAHLLGGVITRFDPAGRHGYGGTYADYYGYAADRPAVPAPA